MTSALHAASLTDILIYYSYVILFRGKVLLFTFDFLSFWGNKMQIILHSQQLTSTI